MKMLLCAALFAAGCTATVDGTSSPASDEPDAGMSMPTPTATPDAAALADNPDDLSRCAPNAWITSHDYPANQVRMDYGLGVPFTDQVLAIRMRVPDDYKPTDPTHLGLIATSEAPAQPPTARALCVSAHACDFTPCPGDFVPVSPSVDFTIGSPAPGVYGPDFKPGQVFWINIWNRTSEYTSSCPYSSCAVLVDVASPNRY